MAWTRKSKPDIFLLSTKEQHKQGVSATFLTLTKHGKKDPRVRASPTARPKFGSRPNLFHSGGGRGAAAGQSKPLQQNRGQGPKLKIRKVVRQVGLR